MIRIPVFLLLVIIVGGCAKKTNRETGVVSQQPADTAKLWQGIDPFSLSPDKGSHAGIDDPDDIFITYVIKAGNNYCENNEYSLTSCQYLYFKASIDSSGIYTTVDPTNQEDINKLYGIADCSSHHQTNSARFGWNWYQGKMHIHAYCYSGGIRAYKELGTVQLNTVFDCELKILPGKYVFVLNGVADSMVRGCTDNLAVGYKLLPYFGGDESAPHDVRIKIKEL